MNDYTLNRKMTYEKVKLYIESAETGNGCTLITNKDEFDECLKTTIGSRIHLKVKCKCSKDYTVIYNAFKNGQKQCQKCGNERSISSTRMKIEDIKRLIEEDFSVNGTQYYLVSKEYKNAKSELVLTDDYGYKYNTNYKNLLTEIKNVSRLYPFFKSNKYTIENIKLWLSKNAPEYKVLSDEYISARHYLIWECPEKHIFKMTLDNFKSGNRCPMCNMSSGEQVILDWITLNGLKFEYQYEFDNCKGKKRNMPFDFAILNDNDSLNFLIEYDGQLHYEESRFMDTHFNSPKERLENQQLHDKLKDKYCKDNNIKLVRIPYWEKQNIFSVLSRELLSQSLVS